MKIKMFLKYYWYIYLIIIAIIEPLTWFSLTQFSLNISIWVNILIITFPAIIVTIIFIAIYFRKKRFSKLTKYFPKDTTYNKKLWNEISNKLEYTKILNEKESMIIYPFSKYTLNDVLLKYDKENKEFNRYDHVLSKNLIHVFNKWKNQNRSKYEKLEKEPWGLQTRLERVDYNHENNYKYIIDLSPIKYLYYFSIQARLWEPELRLLRDEVFGNSLLSLVDFKTPLLPNHFALHMAIISSDNKLLIRQRSFDTILYPGIWEASIGEFMHGPEHKKFPHFTNDGKPSIELFCKNAVAEETNYNKSEKEQFRVFGFGVENRTLAPKLFVIFYCKDTMKDILPQNKAEDMGKKYSYIDFNAYSLAEAFSSKSKYLWSPSSKIISLIALEMSVEDENSKNKVIEDFKKRYNN